MSNKYQSFREFVTVREEASDADIDKELLNNPNLLKQGLPPQHQKAIDAAMATKRMNPKASMDAALRASQIKTKVQQKSVPGQMQPPGQPQPS